MPPSSGPARRSSRPGGPRQAPSPSPWRWLPWVLGGLAILALVAAVVADGKGDDGDGSGEEVAGLEQVRPVEVQGAPLTPLGQGNDPAIGAPAPELEGASFDGTPVTIGDDGRPKVLVFLAHWCPHCQRTVDFLGGWLADNGEPSDVDVYGIATSTSADRPNYPPSAWLQREGWTWPTMADDGTAGQAFGLTSFPMIVAVDSDGRVVLRNGGEVTEDHWESILDAARDDASG